MREAEEREATNERPLCQALCARAGRRSAPADVRTRSGSPEDVMLAEARLLKAQSSNDADRSSSYEANDEWQRAIENRSRDPERSARQAVTSRGGLRVESELERRSRGWEDELESREEGRSESRGSTRSRAAADAGEPRSVPPKLFLAARSRPCQLLTGLHTLLSPPPPSPLRVRLGRSPAAILDGSSCLLPLDPPQVEHEL